MSANQSEAQENAPSPRDAAAFPLSERAYFSPRDAAAYLTISPRTLWQETKNRRIKAARIGRRLIYSRAELDRFMAVQFALAS